VYTHLHVSRSDARKLFRAYAPKPLKPGQSGVVTMSTLDKHFAEYGETHLAKIGAKLVEDKAAGTFVLKFGHVLTAVPDEMAKKGVKVVKAQIVRMNNAPTRARAGIYFDSRTSMFATVERVAPTDHASGRPIPVFAQNIFVSGPTLLEVLAFNSKLSQGFSNRFMMFPFE
jgi:hypothetical protein